MLVGQVDLPFARRDQFTAADEVFVSLVERWCRAFGYPLVRRLNVSAWETPRLKLRAQRLGHPAYTQRDSALWEKWFLFRDLLRSVPPDSYVLILDRDAFMASAERDVLAEMRESLRASGKDFLISHENTLCPCNSCGANSNRSKRKRRPDAVCGISDWNTGVMLARSTPWARSWLDWMVESMSDGYPEQCQLQIFCSATDNAESVRLHFHILGLTPYNAHPCYLAPLPECQKCPFHSIDRRWCQEAGSVSIVHAMGRSRVDRHARDLAQAVLRGLR